VVFTIIDTRICTFSLQEYTNYFGRTNIDGSTVTRGQLEHDLTHDNGQLSHLLGEVFGWQRMGTTHSVITDGNYVAKKARK
jgi:hypothetical protein